MASLTQLTLSASMQWTLSKANTGFASTKQGSDNSTYSNTLTSFGTWTELYAQEFSIASGGGFNEFDLSSFTNLVGVAVTAGHILAIEIIPTGTNAQCLFAPGTTNGLTWFFGGTTPTLTLKINGTFFWSDDPAGTGTVIDSTHKTLRLTNNGSGTLTAVVTAIVGP